LKTFNYKREAKKYADNNLVDGTEYKIERENASYSGDYWSGCSAF